jgi:hypothetical protein
MDFGAIVRNPDTGVITFSSGASPRKISGIGQLVQSLIIELMADPRPELGRGSGFVTLLRTLPTDDVPTASTSLSRALGLAVENILSNQSYDVGLTESERMKSASLRDLVTDGQQWFVDLDLVSVAGERFVLPVS